jgi:DNA-binding beta-propeller fold protein YncE
MSVALSTRIEYSHAIGRLAQSGPGFNNPVDVAAAPGGRLYVLNRSNIAHAPMGFLRVSICTIDEEYIDQFTTFGDGDGELIWPTSIAVDRDVNVYVSDERRHDVQMFDRDGNFLRRWGGLGSGPGQFNRPSGLAADPEGNVVVADSLNNRVQKFARDGQLVLAWGEAGQGPGQFNIPWGITVDRQGRVYVADWRNGRVQQFDADGSYLASFGDRDGDGRLDRPAGLDVDSVGNVYVSDFGRDVVQVYEPDGRHLTTLVGDGTMSKWGAEFIEADPEMIELRERHAEEIAAQERVFEGPMGIAVDDADHIIIADCCKHRLQVYRLDRSA